MVKKLICFVGAMNAGGAETFLMKMYRVIDKSQYQFDFIVNIKSKGFYDEEIESLGGHIFYSTPKSKCLLTNIIENYKILRSNNYDAALRMTSHSLGTIDLIIAKIAGINKLILRSTNAGNTGSKTSYFLHRFFSFLPRWIPTVKIAPSELAAEYLFGKGCVKSGLVQIIHNGLPLDEFAFSEVDRMITRKQLGLEGKFVVGHVGRFNIQKNHKFLISVFKEIYSINKNARLLLIGKGELETEVKKQVNDYGLEGVVNFMGIRKNIPQLLMAMDVFIFPSLFEGMPNTVIEAQATGLPCIISDNITSEVQIVNLVKVLKLSDGVHCWSKEILKFKDYIHKDTIEIVKNKGYDIKDVVRSFQNFL